MQSRGGDISLRLSLFRGTVLQERRRGAGHSVWLRENFGAAKELRPKNSKPSVKRSFLDFFALDCGSLRYRLRMGREQARCRKNCST